MSSYPISITAHAGGIESYVSVHLYESDRDIREQLEPAVRAFESALSEISGPLRSVRFRVSPDAEYKRAARISADMQKESDRAN